LLSETESARGGHTSVGKKKKGSLWFLEGTEHQGFTGIISFHKSKRTKNGQVLKSGSERGYRKDDMTETRIALSGGVR